MSYRELHGRGHNQHDDSDRSNYHDCGEHDDYHYTSIFELEGIPDLCPMESFDDITSHSDAGGDVQYQNDTYQTSQWVIKSVDLFQNWSTQFKMLHVAVIK